MNSSRPMTRAAALAAIVSALPLLAAAQPAIPAFPATLEGAPPVLPLPPGVPSVPGEKKTSPGGVVYRAIAVPKGHVERFREPFERSTPAGEAKPLSREPRPLSRTRLASARYLGMVADHPTGQVPATRVVRYFSDGARKISLREWDTRGGVGVVVQVEAALTGQVGRAPAVLTARANADAGCAWVLSWAADSVDYELVVHEPDFRPETADFVMALANQL